MMTGTATEPTTAPPTPYGLEDEIPLLPGFPGYRTRPGRSGFDYIDTQLELAHMAGIFLRQLFSGRWLHPTVGPHPLVTLLVGAALWLAFPGSASGCPAIAIILLVGLVAAIRNRSRSSDPSEPEEGMVISEEADGLTEDDAFGEGED